MQTESFFIRDCTAMGENLIPAHFLMTEQVLVLSRRKREGSQTAPERASQLLHQIINFLTTTNF